MLSLIIVIGIAFLLQGFFSFLQMRRLTNAFIEMRRKGKVAFGRKSGGFHAGAVVMFRIDDDGMIREGKKMEGVTAFAGIKPLDGFEGRYIGSLTAAGSLRRRTAASISGSTFRVATTTSASASFRSRPRSTRPSACGCA
jgi:DNA-binding transcriptional regulator of glucitol operon